MNVVIAGGPGVLGRRLADDFADRGDDLTILTDRREVRGWSIAASRLIRGGCGAPDESWS